MTLQQLTYLVTVADCGNITEAAEKLFISQPSLSAAIHNLEKEMGVTAFTRSNKGVTVTREGEELLSFARMLLEQADNMKEHFGNGERRTPKFSVSCQHYSFAVNAFVDLIKEYDADKKELFSHTYHYVGMEEIRGLYEFESDDTDSGEFTYFCIAPDTNDTTYHIELRYGSDLDALGQYDAGAYAYWLGSGISTDHDQEMVENCIRLFCTENLSEQ